ncbi:MAG: HAD-IA family hydrolase [Clostridia bacterium]|nr:HAD-IA family hydrolase [Clostridia bacterium]
MKSYSTILFDLDGTLTDPGLGITNGILYALDKMGIEKPPRAELYDFIGPPLKATLMERFHLDAQGGTDALRYYREFYSTVGLFENEVYPGIPELLQKLREAGKTLIVATSKPEIYTKRILERFELAEYFHFVAGCTLEEERLHKDEVIAYAIDQCGLAGKEAEIVMIGDRKYDMEGAKVNNLSRIGVTYGYGSKEELEKAGADATADTAKELETLLL